ncbi:MAG: hypothetical protein LBM93_00450 [Oscillospiraceae bacterium]|nr:hypothetical protein [Oscillospiraceae bacterium]
MFDPYALFPFEQVTKNSKIIVYGAGRAGNNFVQQVTVTDYCTVICIVDKDTKKQKGFVKGLEVLLNFDLYDKVVVSPINFAIRNRIRDDLIQYGVPEEKIVVPSQNNLMYWALDGMLQYENEKISYALTDSVSVDARTLMSSERLDIGIKWLLLRDIANGVDNKENKSLYARHILAWTGGLESFSPTSSTIKNGIEEYISSAKKTLENIQKNGFDKSKAVPVNGDNSVLDGTHRVASCIELDTPIWVQKFNGLKNNGKDFKWYVDNGFNTEDLQRILRAYCELYTGQKGIVVFYGPAMELWNYMQKQLEKQVNIVGYVELDFEQNYLAFETLIHDIYFYNFTWGDAHIDAKIKLLKMSPLKIRVLVISDEYGKCNDNLYGTLRDFKLKIRDISSFDFQSAELGIHSTDSYSEFQHQKNVFLSPNNFKYIGYRFRVDYTKRFFELLDKLKVLCKTHNVNISDICVVNSGVMEVLGLRETKDIDFVCLLSDVPNLSDVSRFSDVIELRDNLMQEKFGGISTDTLITDDNYHFIFYGIKFANLEIVREKKAQHTREKDIQDMRLIDLFTELALVYDNKIAFQKGIYDEMTRRRMKR